MQINPYFGAIVEIPAVHGISAELIAKYTNEKIGTLEQDFGYTGLIKVKVNDLPIGRKDGNGRGTDRYELKIEVTNKKGTTKSRNFGLFSHGYSTVDNAVQPLLKTLKSLAKHLAAEKFFEDFVITPSLQNTRIPEGE